MLATVKRVRESEGLSVPAWDMEAGPSKRARAGAPEADESMTDGVGGADAPPSFGRATAWAACREAGQSGDRDEVMGDAASAGSAAASRAAAAAAARYRDEHTVFVKGLRMNLREGELDKVFAECGDLVAVRLLRDANGRFRVSMQMGPPPHTSML